jgi:hypothetical protein|tara:strand:- start:2354 stop:2536 length:183 start_codon:yes stop_codon:yes gene_type:complete
MDGWYYTLIFVFSTLVILSVLVQFIFNIISDTPNKLDLAVNEKMVYGISMAYIITYLIYT